MQTTLEGVLVVALEQAVAAPLATARLADAGARVIKLERPEGDFARGYDDYVLGQSSYFVWINRGKESCTVDLKLPADLALVRSMLAEADVFVQNLAPGAADRLGLGAAELRTHFPRLIVCDIVGFSRDTPDAERKAYDLLIQAEAGLAGVTGSDSSGPSRVGISISDISTGQAAYAAILEALIARGKTGLGRHLQLSLFDTLAEYMNVPFLAAHYGGREPPRVGLAHPSIAPYGVFSARDGEILVAVQNDREWQTFCAEVLGEAELAADPRFVSNVDRVKNREALDGRVQEAIGRTAREELCAVLDRARLAYGRISSVADLAAHRSAAKASVETPAGPVSLLATPVVVDGRRHKLGPVPALGEHNAALRAEFGGSQSQARRGRGNTTTSST